jgi:hypothetical protein
MIDHLTFCISASGREVDQVITALRGKNGS